VENPAKGCRVFSPEEAKARAKKLKGFRREHHLEEFDKMLSVLKDLSTLFKQEDIADIKFDCLSDLQGFFCLYIEYGDLDLEDLLEETKSKLSKLHKGFT